MYLELIRLKTAFQNLKQDHDATILHIKTTKENTPLEYRLSEIFDQIFYFFLITLLVDKHSSTQTHPKGPQYINLQGQSDLINFQKRDTKSS